MIIAGGDNTFTRFGSCIYDNIRDLSIFPPQNLIVNPNTLLSYSICNECSVYVTRNGSLQAISCNYDRNISNLLPSRVNNLTNFSIKDSNGHNLSPISAVCNFHPVYLYSGHFAAAAIGINGDILSIYYSSLITSPNEPLSTSKLPDGEKAVSIACDSGYFYALSSNGRLFCGFPSDNIHPIEFKEIEELIDETIVWISKSQNHMFAVTDEGSVFVKGTNSDGQLGLGKEIKYTNNFTEVSSLNKYKIIIASAGYNHSLFLTSDGKVLACGSNNNNQLLIHNSSIIQSYYPLETTITSDAKFCIADNHFSVVFINADIPSNSPNKTNGKIVSKKSNNFLKDKKISQLKNENSQLIKEKEEIQKENQSLKEKIKLLESKSNNECSLSQIEEKSITLLSINIIDSLKDKILIGKGGQSHVFRVIREQYLALKELEITESNNENVERLRRLIQEFDLINQLHHRNIIKTYGFCFGDKTHPPSILLEFCPRSLDKVVNQLNNKERITTIIEVCIAMKEIHSHNMVHRDLKPGNILYGDDEHVRISDFGIARLNDDENGLVDSKTIGVGTLKFMDPEILNEDPHYNEKVDVYSFGVVVFFILTNGQLPKISFADTVLGKMAEIPTNINTISKDLILRCWSIRPNDRPSFDEIIEYIKKNNFNIIDGIENEVPIIKEFVSL